MNIKLAVLFLPTFLLCRVCVGQKLPDVKSVNLSASEATFAAKKLVIDNMRISSKDTNLTDFVRGTFNFQLKTQSFIPSSFEIFHNVGVYYQGSSNDSYFANDAATPVTLVDQSGNVYEENTGYSITTDGQPFKVDLTVGQVLSFYIDDNTRDMELELVNSDGAILDSDSIQAGSNEITGSYPILQSGKYTVVFKPLEGHSVSMTMGFGNANRQPLTTITSGYYIETYLREDLRDYYKYRIHLEPNDKLNIDPPSNQDSELVLVNSESVKLEDNTGLGLVYVSSTSEDYYLFVNDSRALGTDYSGRVTISKLNGEGTPVAPTAHAGSNSPGKRN